MYSKGSKSMMTYFFPIHVMISFMQEKTHHKYTRFFIWFRNIHDVSFTSHLPIRSTSYWHKSVFFENMKRMHEEFDYGCCQPHGLQTTVNENPSELRRQFPKWKFATKGTDTIATSLVIKRLSLSFHHTLSLQ